MRSIFLALVILCVPVVSAAQTVTYQLRGFTSTTVLGDHGVLEMTRQCAVEFGEVGATRMCTSSEILNTATVPQGLVGPASVRPDFNGFTNTRTVLDASGRQWEASDGLSCYGWRYAFGSGLVVNSTGGFDGEGCNSPKAIACCHPVVVPEPTAAVGLGAGAAALAALGAGKR